MMHNRVLDLDGVSETLKCPICMEVFDEPVFCGGRPCQHVFCHHCIVRALERSEQCPVCREDMLAEDLHPHQVIRSLLDEVTVVCDRACGWTGRRDAANAHSAVCPVNLMQQARDQLEAESQRFAGVDRQLTEKAARIAELEALVAEKDRQAETKQKAAAEAAKKEADSRKKVAEEGSATENPDADSICPVDSASVVNDPQAAIQGYVTDVVTQSRSFKRLLDDGPAELAQQLVLMQETNARLEKQCKEMEEKEEKAAREAMEKEQESRAEVAEVRYSMAGPAVSPTPDHQHAAPHSEDANKAMLHRRWWAKQRQNILEDLGSDTNSEP